MFRVLPALILLGIVWCNQVQEVSAAPPADKPVSMVELAEEADFVIRGVVKSLTYRELAPEGNEVKLPFTFVTITVEEKLKGDNVPDEVTLRFQGGPLPQKGQFVYIAGAPLFRVGDRNILFVKGNGVEPVPLVNESQGRFRIHEDEVYTEFGQQLSLNAAAAAAAPQVEIGALLHPELHATELPNGQLFQTSPKPLSQAQAAGPGLPTPAFLKSVKETVNRLPAEKKGAVPQKRLSVTEEDPVPALQLANPRPPRAKAARVETPEQERLRKNKGNPVIPKS